MDQRSAARRCGARVDTSRARICRVAVHRLHLPLGADHKLFSPFVYATPMHLRSAPRYRYARTAVLFLISETRAAPQLQVSLFHLKKQGSILIKLNTSAHLCTPPAYTNGKIKLWWLGRWPAKLWFKKCAWTLSTLRAVFAVAHPPRSLGDWPISDRNVQPPQTQPHLEHMVPAVDKNVGG